MSKGKRDVFDKQKSACLEGVDLSKKGSIDAPIQQLIEFINEQPDYFTTSSCSGRIIVVENATRDGVKKKGCKWIFASHDVTTLEELKPKLSDIETEAVLKFEPFVLHVQCRTLADAQEMDLTRQKQDISNSRIYMSCGVNSGYRNSGLSVSTKNKYIAAIRSTQTLEVPLSDHGQLLISDEYLSFLVSVANKKMTENINQTKRFFSLLKTYMANAASRKQQELEKKQISNDKLEAKLEKISKFKSENSSVCDKKESYTKTNEQQMTVDYNDIDDVCDLFGDNDIT